MVTMHTVGSVAYYVLLVAFTYYVLTQVRKPDRWIGRFFTWVMNMSHSGVTDWGLSHVRIEEQFTILDVGCGGGRTIEKIAAVASRGIVCGVDYAAGSVAASRAKNAQLIQAGRVEIKQGSVSELPFPDNKFDLVTAVETQYYWPDLLHDMKEVLRVLKPGGTLIVILESYKRGIRNKLEQPAMKLLGTSNLSADEQRELFLKAGYADVQIFEELRKGWICGVGKKPA